MSSSSQSLTWSLQRQNTFDHLHTEQVATLLNGDFILAGNDNGNNIRLMLCSLVSNYTTLILRKMTTSVTTDLQK